MIWGKCSTTSRFCNRNVAFKACWSKYKNSPSSLFDGVPCSYYIYISLDPGCSCIMCFVMPGIALQYHYGHPWDSGILHQCPADISAKNFFIICCLYQYYSSWQNNLLAAGSVKSQNQPFFYFSIFSENPPGGLLHQFIEKMLSKQ